ncbi:MAG: hypothetical protein Salg2KO_12010 [Salibacteraceae bacterium]
MKLNVLLSFMVTLLIPYFLHAQDDERDFTQYVDPFIGTGGHGHTFPGATSPFGMVQLSPDTRLEGWDGCSGYHYTDNVVYGFSHTHLSGTGVSDYGDVLLMPISGEVYINNGYPNHPDRGYASTFKKESEGANPGYYFTHLEDYDIYVELTATKRVGFHKYTYNSKSKQSVILDLSHRDKVIDSGYEVTAPNEIVGFRRSDNWARDQHIYFVLQFSQPINALKAYKNEVLIDQFTEGMNLTGTNLKLVSEFEPNVASEILVKVGISSVSIDGARKNLEAEVPHWDFNRVKNESRAAWNKELSKIEVSGGNLDEMKTFYTALYHCMIAPNLYSDVDGKYRGTDLQIHESKGHDYYTVFSLWDTFRAAHPLYTIIDQKRSLDFIKTFLAQYQDGGQLPVWELAGNYTGCMIGYHSVSVITDAYMKGITDFDQTLALEAMKSSALKDHLGLQSYKTHGYIRSEDESESVSKTLEYAYDDWCIYKMAEAVGDSVSASLFLSRASNYRNVFDPKTGFMRPKTNGAWVSGFDPREVNHHFTEANSWQYSMFVPHDITGLIELHGGKKNFEDKLDGLFSADETTTGRNQADITGLIGQYAHGNEPSHHMAYLYNYIGKPWKTQERVREILTTLYTPQPDGLSGNEDCGQMSAWYVLSAMGFYSVTPGLPEYAIGSPLFSEVVIHLENGSELRITSNTDAKKPYVQSATLNGEPLNQSYIHHNDIMNGGTLIFEMGPTANKQWCDDADSSPKTSIESPTPPVPFFTTSERSFHDSLQIGLETIDHATAHFEISYPDGTNLSRPYNGPFWIHTSATISAYSQSENGIRSASTKSSYIKIEDDWDIHLRSDYSNQYAAGGNNALIDKIRGANNFTIGSWQGYYGTDLEAVIDLGEIKSVNQVGLGCLQDIKSWIWFPSEIRVFTSDQIDGPYSLAAEMETSMPNDEYGSITKDFSLTVSKKCRYIKVIASNYGQCPSWHLGAGNDTWIFVDEILVDYD